MTDPRHEEGRPPRTAQTLDEKITATIAQPYDDRPLLKPWPRFNRRRLLERRQVSKELDRILGEHRYREQGAA